MAPSGALKTNQSSDTFIVKSQFPKSAINCGWPGNSLYVISNLRGSGLSLSSTETYTLPPRHSTLCWQKTQMPARVVLQQKLKKICSYDSFRISLYEHFRNRIFYIMPKILKPTGAELEILDVLWEYGPSTVKFINEKLGEHKDVGYTTTLKIMQIMAEKKLLTREKEGRSHIYQPTISENEAREVLLDKFLKTAFGGSSKKLIKNEKLRIHLANKGLKEARKYDWIEIVKKFEKIYTENREKREGY